jgi:hypothetical protein
MSGQTDPYVRVYYSIIDDPKFEAVYGCDAALATWLRLLLIADALYPSSAPIPQGTSKRGLALLVEATIVELLPGGQYRVCGLAKERERRSSVGRAGAETRWMLAHSERNANAMRTHSDPDAIGMQAEPSLAKPSNSPKPPQAGARPRSRRANGDTPRAQGTSPRQLERGSPEADRRTLQRLGDLLPRPEPEPIDDWAGET